MNPAIVLLNLLISPYTLIIALGIHVYFLTRYAYSMSLFIDQFEQEIRHDIEELKKRPSVQMFRQDYYKKGDK